MKKYIYFASARVVLANGDEVYVSQLVTSERMLVDNDALQSFMDAFEGGVTEQTGMKVKELVFMSLNFLHTVEGGVH